MVVSIFTCQSQISVLTTCLTQRQISVINILCQAHLTLVKEIIWECHCDSFELLKSVSVSERKCRMTVFTEQKALKTTI